MKPIRLAFAGASGTGKTTLATYFSEKYGLPLNPVGSRSVAREMGFESPYDVDKVGKRAEFQRRLMTAKAEWEAAHDSFVTDRTVIDNLTYTALHDVGSIDDSTLSEVIDRVQRYTIIVFCPMRSFFHVGTDPVRVKEMAYHEIYESLLYSFIRRMDAAYTTLDFRGLARRKLVLDMIYQHETMEDDDVGGSK